MMDILTIKQAAKRSAEEGLGVTEYTIRRFVQTGQLKVVYTGNRALVYYPTLVKLVTCGENENG